jgi:hypothetical protein
MNAPPNTKIAGGLAFQGQPAYSNPVAREMIDPSQAQVAQSLQQTQQGAAQNQLTQSAQMASAMALAAKRALQERAAQDPAALTGMRAIAMNPDILANTGLA